MGDNSEMVVSINGDLPYDIMINILRRLPVKSLIRFKCVAKDWFNLFKTPSFISLHLNHSTSFILQRRIHNNATHSQSTYHLIGPDFEVINPQFINLAAANIIGSCNGLLCVRHTETRAFSIWNPATTEIIPVPGTLVDGINLNGDIKRVYYAGFGFSPVVNDYKLVRFFDDVGELFDLSVIEVSRAEVYSLTDGSWNETDATSLQDFYLASTFSVVANGVMFWKAYMPDPYTLVSFDIGHEMFTLLKGPPIQSRCNVLAVHNNKLAMFHYHLTTGSSESSSIDLWVLEDESWVKQYNVGPLLGRLYPIRIWRDEIICFEKLPRRVDNHSGEETVLCLLNPYNNELKKLLPVQRDKCISFPFNYEESLVQVSPVANIHHEQQYEILENSRKMI